MHYAKFSPSGPASGVPLTRTDTRVYLEAPSTSYPARHHCVGTVYLHNPGSASPSVSSPASGQINSDSTLKAIEGIFDQAMRNKKSKAHYTDPYLEILNLCYYVTPNKDDAYAQFLKHGNTRPQPISAQSKFVWIAWGKDLSFYGPLIQAIIDIQAFKESAFCYDGGKKAVVDWNANVSYPAHPSRAISKFPNYQSSLVAQMASCL